MTLAGLVVCGVVVFFVLLFLLWVFTTSERHPLEDFMDEPPPDTPIFPPPEDSPEPDWQDVNYFKEQIAMLTPEEFQRMHMNNWIEPDWQDDLRAYHSPNCPCPACVDAEASRHSRINSMLRKNSQW